MRWLFVVLLAACSSHMKEPADLAEGPPDMALGGTYASQLALNVSTDITWDGGPDDTPVTQLRFTGSRGTITYDGTTLPAVVYEKILFGAYTLAAVAATMSDGVLIAYVYCENDTVNSIYTEDLVQMVMPEYMFTNPGSCTFTDTPSDGAVSFTIPQSLDYGPPYDIADVDGDTLQIHGGVGMYTLDGVDYALTVFTGVDCTAETCGGMGWQELHATLRSDDTLAFAIFYLRPEAPSTVQVAYGIRFDNPSYWPPDAKVPATWTLH